MASLRINTLRAALAVSMAFAPMIAAGTAVAQTPAQTQTIDSTIAPTTPPAPLNTVPEVPPAPTYDEVQLSAPAPAPAAPAQPDQGSKLMGIVTLILAIVALLLGATAVFFAVATGRATGDVFDELDRHGKTANRQAKQLEDIGAALQLLHDQNQRLQRRLDALERAPAAAAQASSRRSYDPIPVAPTPARPTGPTEAEVEALMTAYRAVLTARDPEPLSRFVADYAPRTLSLSAEGYVEANDSEQHLWFLTRPDWNGRGIIVPGQDAIRNWATIFQPSGGRAAKSLFGSLYTVEPGNLLEIDTPAWLDQPTPGQFEIAAKGILRGA